MIVAPNNFRDEELLEPKAAFEKAGMQVVISSKEVSVATGKLGAKIRVDKELSDVSIADYDALVFVGGPGSTIYFDNQTALNLAQEAIKTNKILGAICIAPSILANAGVLKGKQATAFPSEEKNLRAKGAIYTKDAVVRDGNIITASGPAAATRFGEEILKALKDVSSSPC